MKHARIKIAAQDKIVAALDDCLKNLKADDKTPKEVTEAATEIVGRIKRQMGVL